MRGFFRKAQAVLSIVADTLQIAGAASTITLLAGLAVAFGVALIGWLENVPKLFLALSTLMAFTLFAVVATLARIWPLLAMAPTVRGVRAFWAREQYTDATIRERRDEQALKQHQLAAQLSILDMRIDRLQRKGTEAATREVQELRDQAEELTEEKDFVDIYVEVAWRDLMADFYAKLNDGTLAASGLTLPHEAGKPPGAIPAVEWEFLRFDDSMEIASGQGISYRVVAIRQTS